MNHFELCLGIRPCDPINRGSPSERRRQIGGHPVGRLLDKIRFAQAAELATWGRSVNLGERIDRKVLERRIEVVVNDLISVEPKLR